MNPTFSHIITFLSGLVVGIFGNYFATRLSEKAKNKDLRKERKKKFLEIQKRMPNLINEMRADLKSSNMKDCREFFISPSKQVPFNTKQPVFFYYEDEHPNLISNIRIIERADFIIDIKEGRNSPKYQFTEEFVNLLKK
ncbi:hypothetical protein [Gaoshiqia sediminis]|uniref:Uncharacterized protein n=1 Tax=Gaoshiqia sediminis TaxID=2986998 RepID=A0AA42C6P5_9BACT|nr:hypothetical protein [Gaoshiqia sediminis]MCW0484143.1 hypothetical protein [Gaoshiqia sediminis]